MPLIKRFNASDEYSRLLSTSQNRGKEQSNTEQETPLHSALPLLEETQATFQRLRGDSDFSQTNIFRFIAPFFTFACVLASVATALRKDMMPSPSAVSLVELSSGVFVLLLGVLVALAILRAIIWGGAVVIDGFLLVDIRSLSVPGRENRISKLNQRSILFSGLFS
ncbi:uncharacterized protein BJ212DRAFT_1070385 [Suillus subaureus]|uniref:Uncharacterized protein n=1 Tax=Suillus subaureus TaxID=48587 RepID=A0A9P7EG27_9AGAM|nr:uncharacterized protein BJ212DRAFT_1070385 [Suillus subaureus]KAG1819842.1 hypothetical protein BJ212DRAFT_1070385 [Suillus subaureus]